MIDWIKKTINDVKKENEVKKRQTEFNKAVKEAECARDLRVRNNLLDSLREGVNLPVTKAQMILQKNELCHFSILATRLISKKITVGYESSSSGISFRVAPGVRYYSGGSKGYPIKAEITEKYDGTIVVTSKRIVFINDRKGFAIPMNKLVAVTPYTDGYGFQKDNTNYLVQLSDAEYFGAILNGAVNASIR